MTTKNQYNDIKKILNYTILAASSHNTQPWQFRVSGKTIQIYPDFSRALKVADPKHRELYISLGCALANLQIAANHYGMHAGVTYPDKKSQPIKVALKSKQSKSRYFSYITKRHTNRGKYNKKPLSKNLLQECRKLPEDGIMLDFLAGEDVLTVADLVYNGDIKQFNNPEYRKELGYWLGKGVLGNGLIFGKISQFFVTNFNLGKSVAQSEKELILSSPVYAVLSSNDDIPSWIKTGQAYQNIALYLTSRGISSHPMNQGIMEVAKNREKIQKMVKKHAQFGFRIGCKTSPDKKSPRFPLKKVLLNSRQTI